MKPLIDADIILHELGWSGQWFDKDSGVEVILDWDRVEELLNKKIATICSEVGATEPPTLFLSDSKWLAKKQKRSYTPVFRYSIAKTKPYKGNRKNPKPFHFYNLMVYLLSFYDTVVAVDGYEADDMMCMAQFGRDDTVICSRDKDLRICPGWSYVWECGKQASIGPTFTDRVGSLTTDAKGKTLGYGLAFFYYQMLVGDTADYIPGLPGYGDVYARKLLKGAVTEEDYYERVKAAYIEKLGEGSKAYFDEQANLLWMVQEKGKHYEHPKK